MKLSALFCLLSPVLVAAPVTWTGPTHGDQSWNTPANWSTGAVPGPGAEVTVAVPGDLRVLLTPGLDVTVARLTGTNSFDLSGASLTVTAGFSHLSGPVSIANSTVAANNPGTSFTLSGNVMVVGANLSALQGATLALDGLQSYGGGDLFGAHYVVRAEGAGSLLDLSGVTDFGGPTGRFSILDVTALNGGTVNLPLITDLAGPTVNFVADGPDSLIDLESLINLTGQSLEARNQGSILCPLLALVDYSALSLSDTAELPTDQITSALGASLRVRGGANFAFPALHSYSGGNLFGANPVFRADDAGSRLDLSNVTNLVGTTGRFAAMDISARNGGRVNLTNLQEITQGYLRATSEGTGSRIDCSGLTRLAGQQLEARNGGQVRTPALVQTFYSVLIQRDTARLDLATLTNITGSSVIASDGALLTLPLITAFDGGTLDGQTIESDNPGSVILFPALTRFAGTSAGFRRTDVRTARGGSIQLPLITSLGEGVTYFACVDANSSLGFPNLTTLLGTTFEASGGGAFVCPKLTGVLNTTLIKRGPGSVLPTERITSLSRSSLSALAGATLSFPVLTAYDTGTDQGSWLLESVDAGSLLDFPVLTRFVGALASFSSVDLRAGGGSTLRMPRIVSLGDGAARFLVDGTHSVLDLPGLRSLFGFSLLVRDGGTANCPNLVELANTALTLQGPASFVPTTQITEISRTSLAAYEGAVLAFPNVHRYDGGTVRASYTLEAAGVGSVLDLSQVTDFRGVGADFSGVYASATAGGNIALGGAPNLDFGSASFHVDGIGSRIDLSGATSATFKAFDVRNGGTLNIPNLLHIDRSSLTVVGPGNGFPVGQLVTLTGSNVYLDAATLGLFRVQDLRGSTFTTSNGGKTVFPPAANLIVTDIVAPPAADAGAPVTLIWEVKNDSQNNAAGVRHDGLALRRAGSPDFDFGTVEVSNDLPAQASRRYTNTVIIPAGLTGVWQFVVTVDAGFEVYEGTQEDDNSLVDDAPIGLSSPDLVVTDAKTDAADTLFGSAFTVTWVVKNQGGTNAPSLWEDWLLLSTNPTDFSDAVPLGSFPAPQALAAGQSYTNHATVTAPLLGRLKPGNYFVAVSADGRDVQFESNEANNHRTVPLTLAYPPLADLAVVAVTAPTEAIPGHVLTVRYVIENHGPATATGPWVEAVWIGSAAQPGSPANPLAVLISGDTIPPGGSRVRTLELVVPAGFMPGNDWHFSVAVDRDQAVVETDETNNTATAAVPTEVPASLTLFVPQDAIAENAVPGTLIGQVIRNGDLSQSLAVNLASSQPARLSVPGVLTLLPGQSSVPFSVSVFPDGLATPDQSVTLSASAAGRRATTVQITVVNTDRPVLTLSFPGGKVVEGQTAPAQVTRNGSLDQPLTLHFGSSSPGRLLAPADVVLPPGVSHSTLVFVALDNLVLEPAQTVIASVGAAGFPTAEASLTILDDDLPLLVFTLAKTHVSESAGPLATTALIQRDGQTNAPLVVRITSSNTNAIRVPGTVTIPAGQTQTTFAIGAIDNLLVNGPRTVTLSAVATYTTTGEPVGPTVNQTLAVTDDDGPTLSLTLARKLAGPGLSPATTATIGRNDGTNSTLVIALSSSAPDRARLPASVTLPPGVASAAVTVETPAGAVPGGRTEVTFTATAAAFSPGTDTLVVSDLNRPDLVVTQITAPGTALTKASASIGWQVRNQGLATAKGKLRQIVHLSKDPTLDSDDPVIADQVLDGELPPDLSFTFVRTIFLPAEPGYYWVIVRTDADDVFEETLEDNNIGVSPQPIRVLPAYVATEVGVEVVTGGSGQPVGIHGRLLRTGSNEPAAFEIAAVHVLHDGIDRVLGAVSDADGRFSVTFLSGASEVGSFDVAVGHPAVAQPPVQARFALVGFITEGPGFVTWTTEAGTSFEKRLNIGGLSSRPLTEVQATFINLPPGVTGTAQTFAPILLPGEGGTVSYSLATTPELAGHFQFALRLTSVEGARLDVPFTLDVRPSGPLLAVTPTTVIAGMVRGRQNQVEFAVTNNGYGAAGPLSLALPAIPWLTAATALPVPSLNPGEGTVFHLLLTPGMDLPLTVYTGEIGVVSAGQTVRVPCEFRAVSEAVGDLEITAEDEFTYYTAGAPRVANAHVLLLDPFDQSHVVREISTDASGFAALHGVPEGVYVLRVTAPKHTRRELRVNIAPGLTLQSRVLLPAETVVYDWTVQATEIPDNYRFTIDAKFETNVPFPMVTTDPFLVPLVFPGEITQTSITLTNHGLIAAKGVKIQPRSTQTYLITPLFTDVGDLPAHSSITVPVWVQLQPGLDADFVDRLQQQGRWPQPDAGVQPVVFGGMEAHPARFADRTAVSNRRAAPAGIARPAATPGGKDCEKPSLDILYFVVCGPDGVFHVVSVDIRPVTMLKELNGCIKAIAEAAGKAAASGGVAGLSGVPKAICDCASSVAAGLGGSVPPELKCLCAFIGLDGAGIAECLCPEIPPGEAFEGAGGAVFGAFQPLGLPPFGGDGNCKIIPTGGGGGSAGQIVRAASKGGPKPIVTQAGNGICAEVKLRIEQDLVLTRSAFRATLGLDNRLASPLSAVAFRIDFFDRSGRIVNSLFGGPPPVLSGLTGIDGTGTLAPSTSGSAEFTLIPGIDAAPDGDTPYTVGGELQYKDASGIITVTLQPAPIKVLPQPRLRVDYFHQRDVFSDDPHTPEIEPSEPYTLAVLLRNVGPGPANAIRITSAQPKIIENEKGLLVDFQVIGTETFGADGLRELTPSLTADLGDLPGGGVQIGRWLLKSSVQGLFIDYSARFEHLDGLGQRNLSLVDPDGVKIHEMTHLVRDARPGADALPDFLVNEDFATDHAALPDSVYLSTGAIEPVAVVTQAIPDGVPITADLRVEFSFEPSAGWTYVRVPDPQGASGPRRFRLARVLRSDGFSVPSENFWQTDRTFIGQGLQPIRENLLHLLDHGSTGIYTLIYETVTPATTAPPASQVTVLPSQAFSDFPVNWTGAGGLGGPVAFDIYVSVDDAPFTPWLRDTTLTGAFYPGAPGHRYAFYSVATDTAGNREAVPAAPDATTSTTLTNTPPKFAVISDQSVDEGGLFTLRLAATDSDVPAQNLEFLLGPGAPSGLTLDPATGVLQWLTGEGNGPSTNPVTVLVRDSGSPALTDTRTFSVIVREINSPPILADVPDAVIREGVTYTFTARATDADLPPNKLAFSLAPGAPQGATIDPITGIFTWKPGNSQGPSTNRLTLVVQDDGTPPLSQAQNFTVVVRDTLADFQLRIGRTNLFVGDHQSLAVHLKSGDNLESLEFKLQADPHLLSDLQLLPGLAGIDSAVLQPTQPGEYKASLSFAVGGLPASDADIFRIAFGTAGSAGGVAPLVPSLIQAVDLEGRILRGSGASGLVVVVGESPILLAEPTPQPGVLLFGRPGQTYAIDATSSLDGTPQWQPLFEGITLTGEYRVVPLPQFADRIFLRSRRSP